MTAMRVKAATVFGLMVVSAAAAARADDAKVDNPLYKAWSGHKVGSSATYTAKVTIGGETKTATVTSTLTDKTDDGVTIETTLDGHSTSRTIPAKVSPDAVKADDDADVAAMDKTIKCKKYRISSEADGESGDAKATVYLNDDVVGGLVKMDVGGATVTVTATDEKKD